MALCLPGLALLITILLFSLHFIPRPMHVHCMLLEDIRFMKLNRTMTQVAAIVCIIFIYLMHGEAAS